MLLAEWKVNIIRNNLGQSCQLKAIRCVTVMGEIKIRFWKGYCDRVYERGVEIIRRRSVISSP